MARLKVDIIVVSRRGIGLTIPPEVLARANRLIK